MKQSLKETLIRIGGGHLLNENSLSGYEKLTSKLKGEVLFYAESPDKQWMLGVRTSKNKFEVDVGTAQKNYSITGPEGGDTYSSLQQATKGVKDQLALAKKGHVDPDNKFSFKVIVNKLNKR
tara:strand:+ start:284 stop:649 length:366 start_codon:yes stop_codon:yes gene_type:complete